MKGWSGKVATYGCKDKENGCTEEEEDGAEARIPRKGLRRGLSFGVS